MILPDKIFELLMKFIFYCQNKKLNEFNRIVFTSFEIFNAFDPCLPALVLAHAFIISNENFFMLLYFIYFSCCKFLK